MMEDQASAKRRTPAVDGLFTWPSDDPRLMGGHCRSCGTFFFPRFFIMHRPNCSDPTQVEDILFSRRGKLKSFTIQHYQPPPPFKGAEPFKPYAIGSVELPEGLEIIGILTGVPPEQLRTNTAVEMVVETLYQDLDGSERLTWMFKPIQG